MTLEPAEMVVTSPGADETLSTSPSSQPRRLGLLQCPNAESLGWGGPSSEKQNEVVGENDAVASGDGPNNALKGDDHTSAKDTSCGQDSNKEGSPSNSTKGTTNNDDTDKVANNKEGISNLPRKRPRIQNHTSSQSKDEHCECPTSEEEAGITQEPMKGGEHEVATASSTLPTTELPSSSTASNANQIPLDNISATLEYEPMNKSESRVKERSQILTIVCHNNFNESNLGKDIVSVVVGKISGNAKIQLVPLPSEDDENTGISLSLDVFGYQISSQSINKSILVDRPDWMNALPISVVYNNTNRKVEGRSMLQVRITSLPKAAGNETTDNDPGANGCYYSAYPEESYQLEILPPNSLYVGNCTAAGIGVCTILKPWQHTLDKITDSMMDWNEDLSSKKTDCTPQTPPTKLNTNHNRILLCGAKGVGKSTLLRYATNRILSASAAHRVGAETNSSEQQQCNFNRVAILDLDCGQAELSPPGMLSLTTVSLPVLSDPPVHMVTGGSCDHYGKQIQHSEKDDGNTSAQHDAAYFFGDITSKSDPEIYIQMATQLMARYYKLQELEKDQNGKHCHLPLLVNTDGWVKGLGFEILSAIIGAVNPGHIVQIMGSTKAKSFDMSSHSRGDLVVPRLIHTIPSFDENMLSELDDGYQSRSSIASGASASGALLASASDHRHHRLCAYFMGGYDKMTKLPSHIPGENERITFHKERGLHDPNNIIGMTLASMSPYAVPFHSVQVYPSSGLLDSISDMRPLWGIQGNMADTDVMDSLNGSIVGLCCQPDVLDAPLSGCNAGIGVPVLNCLGLGIIRSVDHIHKIFFVLTPIHPRLLAKVTSFVGGNINLPMECVYRGVYSDSFPFMSCAHNLTNTSVGGDVMKSRNSSRGRK